MLYIHIVATTNNKKMPGVRCTVSFVTQTSTNVRATLVRTERIVLLLTSTVSPAIVCLNSEENVVKQVSEI